jgi:hypothetical protein
MMKLPASASSPAGPRAGAPRHASDRAERPLAALRGRLVERGETRAARRVRSGARPTPRRPAAWRGWVGWGPALRPAQDQTGGLPRPPPRKRRRRGCTRQARTGPARSAPGSSECRAGRRDRILTVGAERPEHGAHHEQQRALGRRQQEAAERDERCVSAISARRPRAPASVVSAIVRARPRPSSPEHGADGRGREAGPRERRITESHPNERARARGEQQPAVCRQGDRRAQALRIGRRTSAQHTIPSAATSLRS